MYRKEEKEAVSPVIAVILMVAITVVLAAVLFVMVQQYTEQSQEIAVSLGLQEGDGNATHWTVAVIAGSAPMSGTEVRLQLDGLSVPSYVFDADDIRETAYAAGNIVWVDSNDDEIINTGDTFLVLKTGLADDDYILVGFASGSQIITEGLTL